MSTRLAAIRSVRVVLWTASSFLLSSLLFGAVLAVLQALHLVDAAALTGNSSAVMIMALTYAAALGVLLYVPRAFGRSVPSWSVLGIARWPRISDMGWALVGYLGYFVASAVLVIFAAMLFRGFDAEQVQDLGITAPAGLELIVAGLLFVVVAPLAEELIFRGYLYGKLRSYGVRLWVAILVTSVLFGAAHMQWNVGVDTFALSVIMCLMREKTGAIWTGVIMHMIKNGLAFYLLFINPDIIQSLGAVVGR